MTTISLPGKRSTAISQTLRAVQDRPLSSPPAAPFDPAMQFRVASSRDLRERAYRLAYEVYRSSGYAEPNARRLTVSSYDSRPDTFTLLATNDAQEDSATVTLIFDSPEGLPCEEIFGREVSALRSRHRSLVEVTRLALSPQCNGDKHLLIGLFSMIYTYARHARAGTDFIIEVNPRHVGYYRRLFGFEVLGEPRNCPRVNGAPAVLLLLNFAGCERHEKRFRYKNPKEAKSSSLQLSACRMKRYPEIRTAQTLSDQVRPITEAECVYFGIPISRGNRIGEFK